MVFQVKICFKGQHFGFSRSKLAKIWVFKIKICFKGQKLSKFCFFKIKMS